MINIKAIAKEWLLNHEHYEHDDMNHIGCKYCSCNEFEEAI